MKITVFYFCLIVWSFSLYHHVHGNPFLRPGSKSPVAPVKVKPAPPPPTPIPLNPNIEFRGYFKLDGKWYFALFDKIKNRGEWLQEGQKILEGGREIQSFNLKDEQLILAGGMKLSLKESEKKTIPLPGGGVSRPPVKPSPAKIPPPRR